MKPSMLSVLAGLAVASPTPRAEQPTSAFHIAELRAGMSKCFVDNMEVKVTPSTMTFQQYEVGSAYSKADGSTENDQALCYATYKADAFPKGWRYAVKDATLTGKATISGGAKISLSASKYMYVDFLEDKAPYKSTKARSGMDYYFVFGEDPIFNVTEFSGAFSVTAKNKYINADPWSPCFDDRGSKYGTGEWISFQYTHTLISGFSSEEGATAAKGTIDDDLKVQYNLQWEKCDPASPSISTYGRVLEGPVVSEPPVEE